MLRAPLRPSAEGGKQPRRTSSHESNALGKKPPLLLAPPRKTMLATWPGVRAKAMELASAGTMLAVPFCTRASVLSGNGKEAG